ncbi:MAG: NADH-quinone oxidoreductase subunit [Bacteroidota bacterium]
MNYSYTILILLLPILMFLFIGLMGDKMKPQLSGLLGTSGLLVITLLSYFTAFSYFGHRVGESFQAIEAFQLLWLQFTDSLIIHIGILLDPLSVMMLVVRY